MILYFFILSLAAPVPVLVISIGILRLTRFTDPSMLNHIATSEDGVLHRNETLGAHWDIHERAELDEIPMLHISCIDAVDACAFKTAMVSMHACFDSYPSL